MSFTCEVQGRAVWKVGIFFFNTASTDFRGNISNVEEGINISDLSIPSGAHISKLFLSSSFVQTVNDTDVECGATTSASMNPAEYETIKVKVFGKSTVISV